MLNVLDKFWIRIEKKPNGCWEWKGGKTPRGYGCFWNKKTLVAHRFSYELLKGKIPKNHELDHLCRNHSCVNPEHLEPVLHQQNVLRGIGLAAINARKTHCIRGHELKGDNLYINPNTGKRRCQACKRISDKNGRC